MATPGSPTVTSCLRGEFFQGERGGVRLQAEAPLSLSTLGTRTIQRKDISMTTNITIKRITDRGFGFIVTAEGIEYFFHQSACAGTPFDQLREGQAVSFTVGQGPKGPRAEDVNVR